MTTYNVQVVNGQAILPYTIPYDMTTQTVETTYHENNQYRSDDTTSTITHTKVDIIVTINSITYNPDNETLHITGAITDEYNRAKQNSTNMAIKINGQTIKTPDGSNVYKVPSGGIINASYTCKLVDRSKTLTIVTSASTLYNNYTADHSLVYDSSTGTVTLE